MDITCPECGFTRSVPDDKIPAGSVRATCPKCKTKFQFRSLPDEFPGEQERDAEDEGVEKRERTHIAPPDLAPRREFPDEALDKKPSLLQPETPRETPTSADELPKPARTRPLIPWVDEEAEAEEASAERISALLKPPPTAQPSEAGGGDPISRLTRTLGSESSPESPDDEPEAARTIAGRDADTGPDSASTLLQRPFEPPPAEPGTAAKETPASLLREPHVGHARQAASKTWPGASPDDDSPVQVTGPRRWTEAGPEEEGPEEEGQPPTHPAPWTDEKPESRAGKRSGRQPPQDDADDIWQRLEAMEAGDEAERRESRFDEAVDWRPEPGAPEVDAPFERLDRHGFFGGLFTTTTRAMFSPGLFFEALPVNKGLGRPLVYAILISLIGHLLMLPWVVTALDTLATQVDSAALREVIMSAYGPRSQITQTIVAPFTTTLQMFFFASIIHVGLFVFQGGKRGFEATFRVLCYSCATAPLAIIPFVGPALALVWSMLITFIGLKRIHRTSYLQVLLALVLPLAILVLLVFAVIAGMSSYSA